MNGYVPHVEQCKYSKIYHHFVNTKWKEQGKIYMYNFQV